MSLPASNEVRIPVDVVLEGGAFFIISITLSRQHFTNPFFIDSLSNAGIFDGRKRTSKENKVLVRSLPFIKDDDRITRTPMEEFIRQYSSADSEKKAGFIFHMSRCGSTLATQMLATSRRCYVLSEPTVINAIFNPALNIPFMQRRALLNAALRCFAGYAPRECEFIFVKFRSWNTLFMKEIVEGFSHIPWVFMHRNGAEILASVLDRPPGWLRSKSIHADFFSERLELAEARIRHMRLDEFTVRILGAFCRSAVAAMSTRSYHIDYATLPGRFIRLLQDNWNMDLSAPEKQAMLLRAEFYSKDPTGQMRFVPDREAKLKQITAKQYASCVKYVELERERLPVINSSLVRELKLL
jgi:hypothetical protein